MSKEKENRETPEEAYEEHLSEENNPDSEESSSESQLEEYKGLYMRTLADFENYRRRKEQELQEVRERAIKDFAEELLPIIDNFEMSLQMGTSDIDSLRKGVQMIHKNLQETLEKYHIKSYQPEPHSNFDPHHHEPVLVESEEHAPGTVVSVIQPGYRHKDKVIRPARVQVVKEEQEESSNSEN